MDARQAEIGRDLREAHGVDAASGVPTHLLGGEVRVPQRHDDQWDEAAVGSSAPLLDLVVVVGLHTQQRQLLVRGLREGLATEAGEGREAERRLNVVDVHVLEALLLGVRPWTHVLIRDTCHGHLVSRHTDGRVDPQQRSLQLLVEPPVGRRRASTLVHGELATLVGDVGHVLPDDPRADICVLRGKPRGPEVGGLDDVVVDGNDLGQVGHESDSNHKSDAPSGPPGCVWRPVWLQASRGPVSS